jgi:transposase
MTTMPSHSSAAAAAPFSLTLGLDLGDRRSAWCVIAADARLVERGTVATEATALRRWLAKYPGARVVMEVGTHSPWVSRLVAALGHEAVVANPSELYGKTRRRRRNDKLDAEGLARLGRADVALLHPIRHRGEQAQVDRAVLQARDVVVGARTALINCVRGTVKAFGRRLSGCGADAFAGHVREEVPAALGPALLPLLDEIAALTARIHAYDRETERLARERYPETARLRQVGGVGVLTALAYVLVLEDPRHFPVPRAVGSYLGLVGRLDDSGEWQPQLPITKAGNALLRKLLVQAAHYILGPFGPDTDLRRWGEGLMKRGGKNAKKRAVVAVARKLAVLLHRLWATGAAYEPLRHAA